MELKLWLKDGTTQIIRPIQSVKASGPHELTTQTFGNGPVIQRNVAHFTFVGSFETTPCKPTGSAT